MNISFVFPGKMDLINPWLVSSFEEFLFYCCPECDIKTKEKGQLYEHAVQEHQLAKELRAQGAYIAAPKVTKWYCISCAIHFKVLKIRSADQRRRHTKLRG